jgi:hypothetical protein
MNEINYKLFRSNVEQSEDLALNDKVNIRIAAHHGLAYIGVGFVRQSDQNVLNALFPLLVLEISRIEHLDRNLIAKALSENREIIFLEQDIGWVFRYRYSDETLPKRLHCAFPQVLRYGTSQLTTLS